MCLHATLLQWCLTLCDPMDCRLARLLCPGDSSDKNTGVGCQVLLQGRDLSNAGIEPTSLMSPELAVRFFTTSATWETLIKHTQFSHIKFIML